MRALSLNQLPRTVMVPSAPYLQHNRDGAFRALSAPQRVSHYILRWMPE